MGKCGKDEKEWLLKYLFSMQGGEFVSYGRSLLPVDESSAAAKAASEEVLEEVATLRKASEDLTALIDHLRKQLDSAIKEKEIAENQLSILSSLSDNKMTKQSALMASMENLEFEDLRNLVVEMLHNLDEDKRMQILQSVIGGMTDKEVLGVTLHTMRELSREDKVIAIKELWKMLVHADKCDAMAVFLLYFAQSKEKMGDLIGIIMALDDDAVFPVRLL